MKTPMSLVFACAASALIFDGCGEKPAEEAKPQPSSIPSATSNTAPRNVTPAPAKDPARNIDGTFFQVQWEKRVELDSSIQSFKDTRRGDPSTLRKKILNRKGEILSLKRNIRNSNLFTDAQKDSLIKPLDEESMSLSTELIAFGQ